MTTLEDREHHERQIHNAFREVIDRAEKESPQHVVVSRYLELAHTITACRVRVLPDRARDELLSLANQARDLLLKASPQENLNALENINTKLEEDLAPSIGWSLAAATDVQAFQEQTTEIVKQFKNETSTLTSEQEDLIANLKSERTINTVTKHAGHFKEEAKRYRDASYCWLGAAVFVAVLTLCYATLLLLEFTDSLPKDPTMAVVVAHALPKIILLSLLSVAMAFSIRNYGANCHNYVVNSHRMRALSTFDTFLNSTEDPVVKNAILLHTASTIFSPQSTGFSKIDHEIKLSSPAVDLMKGSGG